jgi:membrane associated rhomboid family serine protease
MLIPIGQEDNEVRRHPWVSYTLILLNFLFFLAAINYDSGWFEGYSDKVEEVFSYVVEHPYLEVPPIMEQFLSEEDTRYLDEQRSAFMREAPAHERAFLDLEQKKLDELVASWDEVRRQSFSYRFGLVPAERNPLTALTSLFVHAGWIHLLGNMLFFFVTGPFLEDLYGRPLFATFYVLAGVVATLTHALKFPDSIIPLVGASGAVAGVMGAFLIRLGRSRMKFLFLPVPLIPAVRFTFHLRAFVFLPLWLGEQLLYAGYASREAGVAWWAHIGGFVFGMAVAGLLRLTQYEERYINPAIEKEISYSTHPSLEKAIEARFEGQFEEARAHIRKVLNDEPTNFDAWAESYNIAVAGTNMGEAGRIATRLVSLYARSGEVDLAFEFIEEAREQLGDALPAKFYVEVAGLHERERDFRSAMEFYRLVSERFADDPAAYIALFRCGKFYRRAGNLNAARDAFTRARAHPACVEPEQIDLALAAIEKDIAED